MLVWTCIGVNDQMPANDSKAMHSITSSVTKLSSTDHHLNQGQLGMTIKE